MPDALLRLASSQQTAPLPQEEAQEEEATRARVEELEALLQQQLQLLSSSSPDVSDETAEQLQALDSQLEDKEKELKAEKQRAAAVQQRRAALEKEVQDAAAAAQVWAPVGVWSWVRAGG